MSINHLTNPDINPKLDIYCKNLNSIGESDIGVIKDLKFKAVDESVIHASSLFNQGDPGQVLTSFGDGSLYWSSGSSGSGIEYTGTQPVLLNSLTKYNSFDGSSVSKTTFTDTDILLKNGSVQMTGSLNLAGNSIDNNLVLNTAVLSANISESPIITVNDTLDMTNSSIVNCFRVTTDSLQAKTVGGNITILSNLEMKNDDILNCSLGEIATLDTSIIKNTNSPDIVFPDNSIQMNQNDISDINLLNDVTTAVINTVITASITSSSTDILVGKNLNLENNEITNVTNITTTDINTNTISAISPAPSVKLTTDLDLDGNNIIGLTTINGIQASGGVYSNTGDFAFSGATPTTNLLNLGTSYGSTIIPADVFKAGDIYTLKIGGQLTCDNNDIFNIAIVSNFGLPSECVFSNFSVSIDGAKLNDFWEIEIDFSVRTIGGIGVASITTNGDFTYFNSTNVKKGYGISEVQNTTFNTEIDNTLAITYSTAEVSITNFQIDQASLMKFF